MGLAVNKELYPLRNCGSLAEVTNQRLLGYSRRVCLQNIV
jgi:hypothetical protein